MFEKMLGYSNHLGLFAEMTGLRGQALGNFPQAFSHLGLISAAYNLNRTLDEHRSRGRAGPAAPRLPAQDRAGGEPDYARPGAEPATQPGPTKASLEGERRGIVSPVSTPPGRSAFPGRE